MNETLDEQPSTSVPSIWKPFTTENPQLISDLFYIISLPDGTDNNLKVLAFQSLT